MDYTAKKAADCHGLPSSPLSPKAGPTLFVLQVHYELQVLVIGEPELLTSSTYFDRTQTSAKTPSSFKECNAITTFPLPWDKSRTVLPSNLEPCNIYLQICIGFHMLEWTSMSSYIFLTLTFLLCDVFNFYYVCTVIAQLYLTCFVPSLFVFLCTFVCVSRTCM